MWALDNRTPFAADSGWIRDSDGAEVWIVAVKATYDILRDGDTRIASEQVPVHSGPVPHDDLRSLRYDIDLGPSKPATDILLNGHAYAQGTQPVEELHVGFRVGSMKRLAKVSGDRYWRRGMLFTSASKPVPFMRMPLVYERAFGGDSPDAEHGSTNPLGRGITPEADGRVWLPNVELLTHPIHKPGDRPAPMSFGPLPCHWPERQQYAGTCDEAWLKQRFPLPPKDLDPRHWQLAPAAQQVDGHLRGGEEVVLVNLTPPGFAADGRLSFKLPKLTLAFQTYFTDGHSVTSRSRIHTVILEPDHPRVSIVHHMALSCHEHINRLDKTRILQKRRPLDRPFSPVHADLEWPAGDDQQGANQ